MLPHLKPESLDVMWPAIELLFNAGRIISALAIVGLHILKNKLPSKPVWMLAILQAEIFFSTVLNHGNIQFCFLRLASILSIALIIDFFAVRAFDLISGILMCFELLLCLNFISVLIYYPEALYISDTGYEIYFLGFRNTFIIYVLPAIVVAMLYYSATKKKLRPILLAVSGIAPIFITWSATSICGVLMFVSVFALSKTPIRKWVNFRIIFTGTMIINLLISVFRVMERVSWISNFIKLVLKKRVTLTGRTFIWDCFFPLFSRSPLIGYGSDVKFRTNSGFLASHMHNQWFQFLFEGGIFALLFFLILNFVVGARLNQYNRCSNVYIFLAAFSALYVLFIAEAYSRPLLFMLYIIAYHIDKFEAAAVPSKRKLRIIVR